MSWTAKQHLWKSKANEGHHLSGGGPSNRQKIDIKIASLATLFHENKRNILWFGNFLFTCECDDERACYLIIKKHVY